MPKFILFINKYLIVKGVECSTHINKPIISHFSFIIRNHDEQQKAIRIIAEHIRDLNCPKLTTIEFCSQQLGQTSHVRFTQKQPNPNLVFKIFDSLAVKVLNYSTQLMEEINENMSYVDFNFFEATPINIFSIKALKSVSYSTE